MKEEIDIQAAIPETFDETALSQAETDDTDTSPPDSDGTDSDGQECDTEALCNPLQEADNPDLLPAIPSDKEARVAELEHELARLKAELEARDARDARAQREYEEFRALYPDVPSNAISDTVRADVQRGIPLAAAFALDERRQQLLTKKAAACNAENSRLSSGAVSGSENLYFSPAEVRAMTQAEIRKNYNMILESMKSWH